MGMHNIIPLVAFWILVLNKPINSKDECMTFQVVSHLKSRKIKTFQEQGHLKGEPSKGLRIRIVDLTI